MTNEVKAWLLQREKSSHHRQLLVISGTNNWVNSAIRELLTIQPPSSKLWVSNSETDKDIAINQYKSVLGQEFDWVIYDGFDELRGNALLALSGCVSKGGLMILLCPTLKDWPYLARTQQDILNEQHVNQVPSSFTTWLVQHIKSLQGVSIWEADTSTFTFAPHVERKNQSFKDDNCKTPEQFQLVEYLTRPQSTENSQVVVLADRGRGKSSALGIAASQIILQPHARIIVTSAHKSMTNQIFAQAKQVFQRANLDDLEIQSVSEQLTYLPFDRIIKSLPKADWLFIDEAASLPTEILEKLVQCYSKVVLSTTIHGYEGSGRGFELRFKPFLKNHFKQYQEFVMHSPIRWYENDPLEAFWHQVMAFRTTTRLNNVKCAPLDVSTTSLSKLTFKTYTGELLIREPELLQSVFELMVDAHYQTSPDDLVRMLDAGQHIHIVSNVQNVLVAVALTNMEGGEVLQPLVNEISQGTRRIPGHLIPQRLAFDHYEPNYALMCYMRIVRIAVSGEYRQQGFGSQLINYLYSAATNLQVDFIGSSFGLTNELARFWFSNDFRLVKLGIKRDASSGEYSAIMLRSMSSQSAKVVSKLVTICQQQIDFHKTYRLCELPIDTIEFLLSKIKEKTRPTSNSTTDMNQYWERLMYEFIAARRPLHTVELAIFRCLITLNESEIRKSSALTISLNFVHDVIIQKLNYSVLREKYTLTGKKHIEQSMREHLSHLFPSEN